MTEFLDSVPKILCLTFLAVVILWRRLFYFMLQKTWCIILGAHGVWTFRCSHVAQKCCLGMQICWFWDSCWLVWGSPLLMKSFFCSLFSVSAHSGPSPLLCLLLGFHGDQPKAMSTHLFVHNVFFFSLSSVLHVLPYKPVLESWKGFYSLESLFPLFYLDCDCASSKITKNSYCGWL